MDLTARVLARLRVVFERTRAGDNPDAIARAQGRTPESVRRDLRALRESGWLPLTLHLLPPVERTGTED